MIVPFCGQPPSSAPPPPAPSNVAWFAFHASQPPSRNQRVINESFKSHWLAGFMSGRKSIRHKLFGSSATHFAYIYEWTTSVFGCRFFFWRFVLLIEAWFWWRIWQAKCELWLFASINSGWVLQLTDLWWNIVKRVIVNVRKCVCVCLVWRCYWLIEANLRRDFAMSLYCYMGLGFGCLSVFKIISKKCFYNKWHESVSCDGPDWLDKVGRLNGKNQSHKVTFVVCKIFMNMFCIYISVILNDILGSVFYYRFQTTQ